MTTGPPGSFNIVLSVRAPDGSEWIVAEPESHDAAREAYFAGFAGPGLSPNRSLGRARAVAVQIPNTPRLTMIPGTWTFRIGLFELGSDDLGLAPQNVPLEGSAHVGVVSRVVDPLPAGKVDLAFSLHASSGLDATTAPSDPVLQRALSTIDTAFEAVGMRVGTVSYVDLDAPLPQPLDLGGPSCLGGDLERVFDAVEPVPDVVNMVLVGSFTCLRFGGLFDVGANLVGISNGVPGIPFATRDGIVLATALKDDYPDDWALVLAHELGHYLGLYHTAEGIPDAFDNIEDTDDDAPEDYLMFYDISTTRSTVVTPDQGVVLRSHPLLLP